jgi:hypothetical protein
MHSNDFIVGTANQQPPSDASTYSTSKTDGLRLLRQKFKEMIGSKPT